jgi:very-short-patch-repair endonuclease
MRRLTPFARKLRREATPAERCLWGVLKNGQLEGVKFRRQAILGDYIVDFAAFETRLIVEVDGATHSTQEELTRDALRERKLRAMGFAILRFQNAEVFENLKGVEATIRLKVSEIKGRFESMNEDHETGRGPSMT